MNYGAKVPGLPDLTANLLRDGGCLIDNLFADLWRQMRMKAIEQHVQNFFVQALQLDVRTLRLEAICIKPCKEIYGVK
jgi:hypothetical protein